MKALLIYSHNTGATRRGFSNKLDYVKERLLSVFNTLDSVCTLSKEETRRLIAEKGSDYESLIIVGVDRRGYERPEVYRAGIRRLRRPLFR